jgi:hypothetical protein
VPGLPLGLLRSHPQREQALVLDVCGRPGWQVLRHHSESTPLPAEIVSGIPARRQAHLLTALGHQRGGSPAPAPISDQNMPAERHMRISSCSASRNADARMRMPRSAALRTATVRGRRPPCASRPPRCSRLRATPSWLITDTCPQNSVPAEVVRLLSDAARLKAPGMTLRKLCFDRVLYGSAAGRDRLALTPGAKRADHQLAPPLTSPTGSRN